jgi:hypothetical protein
MKAFFSKYPVELSEDIAISMIHKKLECAEEEYSEDGEEHLKYLAVAYSMLEDFFDEKGLDPNTLL